MIWLLLAAGALGAVLRLLLDRRLVPEPSTSPSPWRGWPVGILLANLCGTLLLGIVLGFTRSRGLDLHPRDLLAASWPRHTGWLLATGFCGSLSTVSTLFVGVDALFGQLRSRGWCYLGASLAGGLLAGLLGALIGGALA